MLLPQPVNDKLNEQIANEKFAAYSYIGMSAFFDQQGMILLGKMFREQAAEESEIHAAKFLEHIINREGKVQLPAIPAAKTDYTSVVEALEAAYDHEIKVSNQVHALQELAEQHNDRATAIFLDWFVEEQIEEVRTMYKLREVARAAGPHAIQVEAYLVHIGKAD